MTSRRSSPLPMDPLLWGAIAGAALLLGGLSVARYAGYNAGMLDLGNMAQAIGSVHRGHPLLFTYQDGTTSRLAFHVELIYFLIALPYLFWPDPRFLVILQAVWFAVGALPVYSLTLRRTGNQFAARSLAFIYLLYPTAQTSVLFDFHADTLAMPLLLFVLDALDRRAWVTYGILVVLSLTFKVYVSAVVVVMGMVIWWSGYDRRAGLLTAAAGLVYGAFAFLVVRPLFTTESTSQAHRGFEYITYYFGNVSELIATWDQRLLSAIVVFGPVMLLAWRGWRWLLPGIPVAIAALLSTGPGGAYDYRYHHYALVVPFLIMAAIDGTAQRARESLPIAEQHPRIQRRRRPWRSDVGLTLAIVAIFSILLVDTPLNPLFWMGIPGQGLDSSVYGILPRDAIKDEFLRDVVPPEAPIAASTFLATHLTNRDTLYLVRYPDDPGGAVLPSLLPSVDYVLTDALFDYRVPLDQGFAGGADYEIAELAILLRDPTFQLVAMRDGLLFFARDAHPTTILHQHEPEVIPTQDSPQFQFGKQIGLITTTLELTTPANDATEHRVQATFDWRLIGDEPFDGRVVAVSQLVGVEHARFVHIPTYALLPPREWPQDHLIRETFEVALPADLPPGYYEWRVAWYNLDHRDAYATDDRSRLSPSSITTVGELEIPPLSSIPPIHRR